MEVAKEDMEEVVTATEEVAMEVAEEGMEEAVVDMEVEAAVVTTENHAMISIWYCTQLPFYDIYYVSRFNTCEKRNKNYFYNLTRKHKNPKTIPIVAFYYNFTISFRPLLMKQMKLCSTIYQVFIFILKSINNKRE